METADDPHPSSILIYLILNSADVTELVDEIDPMVTIIQVIIILAGLLLSGLFSGSEVAFFSLSTKVDEKVKELAERDPATRRALVMLDRPRKLLATILIGNTFSNIITAITAAVLTGKFAYLLGAPMVVVYAIEIVVLTFMILILAEITPKMLALKDPLDVSRKLSGFLYFFFVILSPFSNLIARSTHYFERQFPRPPERISSEDIKTIAEVGELQGSLHEDEREIIENVIEFGNTVVREIMTSRVNIIAVSTEDKLEDVIRLIKEKSASRLPLYEGDMDNILGIIHSKDLLPYMNSAMKNTAINWKSIARKPLFIPATKKLDDLLRDFQKERTHVAIVVDEYGGTEGLVTLDDILEEIIGEISDENSEQKPMYVRRKSGVYIFDAKVDLDDMEKVLQKEITSEDDEYETLAGLIYHLTEHIPEVGEKVTYNDLELMVYSVEKNRIRKVMVRPIDAGQEKQVNPEHES